MISCISGLPGKGKNVYATYLALKHFDKTNSLLKRCIRRIKHQDIIINNVYSTYPILLDKKKMIYSRLVTLDDMKNQYSFLKDSLIIVDEVQSFYDSDEFKDFPKEIAVFNCSADREFLGADIIVGEVVLVHLGGEGIDDGEALA